METDEMSKLNELRQALGVAIDELNSDACINDAKAYEAKQIEIAEINAKIRRVDEAQKQQAALARPASVDNPGQNPLQRRPMHSRLKFFKGANAEERAYRFGQFALAALWGNEKAFAWCRENGIMLQRAQSEGVNSAGGFLVPEEFSMEIIDLRDQYGLFRRLCQVVPMGRDTMTVPRRTGGLTAYAVGEGTAITASQGTWDQVRLTANKWGVLTLMSSELDEDAAVNVGDLLVGEMGYAFAISEDTAGFSGDGTSTYHGIRGFLQLFGADQISAGASTLAGALDAAAGHDTFGEIDSTDITNLMGKLPQYAYLMGDPSFYCSQLAWATVFQRLIASAGGISKSDITGKVEYQYLGFPVEISPSMPAVTTDLSDKPMILFGDIGLAATFGNRRGMAVARSTEYKFAEDQIAIKATERFDISVHDIGTTTVAGPVVALIGE
jgi:HK97 family phage major capsid protein